MRLALDGIFNFSYRPLQVIMWLGMMVAAGALILGTFVLVQYFADWTVLGFNPRQARGWTSLIFVQLFASATQLLCLGILGEYIGRLMGASYRKPVYTVAARTATHVDVASRTQATSGTGT